MPYSAHLLPTAETLRCAAAIALFGIAIDMMSGGACRKHTAKKARVDPPIDASPADFSNHASNVIPVPATAAGATTPAGAPAAVDLQGYNLPPRLPQAPRNAPADAQPPPRTPGRTSEPDSHADVVGHMGFFIPKAKMRLSNASELASAKGKRVKNDMDKHLPKDMSAAVHPTMRPPPSPPQTHPNVN